MEFIRSQVFCVFFTVFDILFCVDLAYRVEGDILRLANIGDNITLSCYRGDRVYDNYKNWYRNETFIANWNGVYIKDPRFTQGVTNNGYPDSNNIYISNIRMNDSAIFKCYGQDFGLFKTYDLRVIGCSNCNKATTLSTISLKQTTQNRPSTLSYTASKKLTAGRSTSISTTKHHSPTNKNTSSDQNTRDGNITLIIVILGCVFILILIVIIIVQRSKKKKDRRENKDTSNASLKEEHPEVRYESVEAGSGKGSEYTTLIQGLRETSLDQRSADRADKKEHPEVRYESVEDGSRKGPGYVTSIKELRGNNRESKSTSKVGSSNSDYLYGNSAIITQHEQIRGTLQKGNQYDDVKIPGSGDDAEEIPLYEMPDKGPTRNTLKATPEAGQIQTLPKDEVVSVDALYVDVY